MEVRVYRAGRTPTAKPGATRANDRQADMRLRSDRVTVIRRNLQYPSDYPVSRATEKGIDVAIAVDMIRLGMSGYMDAAILFSSDTTSCPRSKPLWVMPHCHVEVACWSSAHRIRFPGTQQPWCHHLSEADLRSVSDAYDYSDRE